jgi:hypothetical protein
VQAAEALTAGNWRRAVRHAVDALPPDIRPGVAYSEPHAKAVRLTVACRPGDVRTVLLTWRDPPHVPPGPDPEPLSFEEEVEEEVVEVWAELPAHVIIACQAGKDLLAVRVGRDSVAGKDLLAARATWAIPVPGTSPYLTSPSRGIRKMIRSAGVNPRYESQAEEDALGHLTRGCGTRACKRDCE